MKDRLSDHHALLSVIQMSLGSYGFWMLTVGVTAGGVVVAIGVLALVTALALQTLIDDPAPPDPTWASGPPSEIALMTEAEFDLLLDEVERQARLPFAPPSSAAADLDDDDEFAEMVRDALDELPDFVQIELQRSNVGVTISDQGSEWKALGLYCGGSIAEADFPHTITIFRDTLTAHYGHDPDELRRQVKVTVRHEVAHHLGANERRVRELGL